MRVWGERAALLERAGADVSALAALERSLEEGLGTLPREGGLDAHVHLGRDRDGHALDGDALVEDLDRWGLATAVCFPADEPGDDGRFTRANAAVAEAASRHPGRIVPFCRVDPSRPGAAAAAERAARDGARGLKLHPVAQRLRPESPEFADAVRDATARGWPVTIHAGYGARALAAPIGALVAAVPGARLVLAHAGRGDARALAARLPDWPGVLLDTSLASLADLVTLPPERLVFGSDRPYGEHATALALVAAAARIAGWDAAARGGVMGATMRRWLP
jgi:uncharacterized protein